MFVPESLSKFFTPRYLAANPMSSGLPASPAMVDPAQSVSDAIVEAAGVDAATAAAAPQTLHELFDANRLRGLLPVAARSSGARIDAVIPLGESVTSSDSDDAD